MHGESEVKITAKPANNGNKMTMIRSENRTDPIAAYALYKRGGGYRICGREYMLIFRSINNMSVNGTYHISMEPLYLQADMQCVRRF